MDEARDMVQSVSATEVWVSIPNINVNARCGDQMKSDPQSSSVIQPSQITELQVQCETMSQEIG